MKDLDTENVNLENRAAFIFVNNLGNENVCLEQKPTRRIWMLRTVTRRTGRPSPWLTTMRTSSGVEANAKDLDAENGNRRTEQTDFPRIIYSSFFYSFAWIDCLARFQQLGLIIVYVIIRKFYCLLWK